MKITLSCLSGSHCRFIRHISAVCWSRWRCSRSLQEELPVGRNSHLVFRLRDFESGLLPICWGPVHITFTSSAASERAASEPLRVLSERNGFCGMNLTAPAAVASRNDGTVTRCVGCGYFGRGLLPICCGPVQVTFTSKPTCERSTSETLRPRFIEGLWC